MSIEKRTRSKWLFYWEVKQMIVPTEYSSDEVCSSVSCGRICMSKEDGKHNHQQLSLARIIGNVTRFCTSCDICQRTVPRGKVANVLLGEIPLIKEPFSRVPVDLIRPLAPAADEGNLYILTVVDIVTSHPKFIALPKIEMDRVEKSLPGSVLKNRLSLKEMLSNRETQFTSELMQEVCKFICTKNSLTPRYNRLCEKVNIVLKSILKKMYQERPCNWDKEYYLFTEKSHNCVQDFHLLSYCTKEWYGV
ncbi:uncharacterized protein LOC143250571 [Tachypleus tridentatus]|uniref:uncharacterized protein LOC143250571 n=1 Tax=Tachypleus tridentatus TaxID=6853 RepID=UPI003FD58C13